MALASHCRTARLALRPVATEDETAVVVGVGDLSVARWLAVVPHPYTAADFRYFLEEIAVPGETFVIQDASGVAGIISIVDGELGYWIAPRAQGLGYATEAGRCLVDAHFAGSVAPLTSGYFEGNTRSANVLGKLGFVETGRDIKHCRARGADLPHVTVGLQRTKFVYGLLLVRLRLLFAGRGETKSSTSDGVNPEARAGPSEPPAAPRRPRSPHPRRRSR